MTARKLLALFIVSLWAGTMVEAQRPDGRVEMIPVTGGVVVGLAVIMRWAMEVLSEGDEG